MIRLLAGAMLATMTLYPLGATASMTPHNETPRALTALDLVNLKRVSDPRISPDGKSVAYRSEEHTSEFQSLMSNSYAVFCLKKKNKKHKPHYSQVMTHKTSQQR